MGAAATGEVAKAGAGPAAWPVVAKETAQTVEAAKAAVEVVEGREGRGGMEVMAVMEGAKEEGALRVETADRKEAKGARVGRAATQEVAAKEEAGTAEATPEVASEVLVGSLQRPVDPEVGLVVAGALVAPAVERGRAEAQGGLEEAGVAWEELVAVEEKAEVNWARVAVVGSVDGAAA